MTDKKQKLPGAKAAARLLGPRLVSVSFTFALYLVFAWVLSVALRHSVGVGVPWFPLAVLIQFGSALVRMLAEHIGSGISKGVAAGKHEAEVERAQAALKAVMAASPDTLAGLFGKAVQPEAPSSGAYL